MPEPAAALEDDLEDLLDRGYRFALGLVGDPAAAEDLLQEACLAVTRARGPWVRAYLFRAIRSRLVNDRVRRSRSREEPTRDLDVLPIDLATAMGDDEPLAVVNGSLERALAELSVDQRGALYLAAVEGFTARELSLIHI